MVDNYAYVQAGLFIAGCAAVGAILGVIVGMLRKDGPRAD